MKKLILFLSVCCTSFVATAQLKDAYIGDLMTKRILSCDDIGYNAALLIPRMYKESKTDTLDAIITYWERNCGMTEPATSFSILYAIEHNTFEKQTTNATQYNNFTDPALADTAYFNKNIMATLYAYRTAYDARPESDSNLDDPEIAYRLYYDLIREMAASLLHKTSLSPLEKFIVNYYSNPRTTSLSELAEAPHDNTPISHAYLKQKKNQNSFNGIDYALTAGEVIPQGNLATLGPSTYLGCLLGGKRNKWTFDFDFYVNFPLQNTKTYMVSNNDSLTPSNTFLGFYTGLDAAYELFQVKKSELDILGCIGLQGLYVLNGNNGTANLTLVSANPNFGLGYKLYLSHKIKNATDSRDAYIVRHSYIGIQAKYNMLFFNNYPGTSLSGNAFTVSIIYGGTTKRRNYNE